MTDNVEVIAKEMFFVDLDRADVDVAREELRAQRKELWRSSKKDYTRKARALVKRLGDRGLAVREK